MVLFCAAALRNAAVLRLLLRSLDSVPVCFNLGFPSPWSLAVSGPTLEWG